MTPTRIMLLGGGLIARGAFVAFVDARRALPVPPVYVARALPGGYNAICLPPFGVFVRAEHAHNRALIEHEAAHWRQFRERGLVGWYAEMAAQYLFDGYDRAALEVEARVAAGEHPDCLYEYTACVRDGRATTVHAPRFRM